MRLLSSDADTQNAWLHPCGWTREEPFVHTRQHRPCASIAELVSYFGDMWPAWQPMVTNALPAGAEPALDRLDQALQHLDEAAYVDEIQYLDGEDWRQIRRVAADTLAMLEPSDAPPAPLTPRSPRQRPFAR